MYSIIAKSILSKNNGMNIYRGCTHGCIYCDSRSECYQLPKPFENIGVKVNAIELLDQELSKKKKPTMLSFGSMSDPYMQIEKELLMTRKCLEIVHKHHFGIHIQTKSDLILRDLDILKKINQDAKVIISMTITTFNDELTRLIEPNVCNSNRRFEVLETLKKEGIEVGIWLCPILPFLNDTKYNILSIIERCHQIGVSYIMCFDMGVTLRKGDREYFYQKLDEHFPRLRPLYEHQFGEKYICSSQRASELMELFVNKCHEYHILYQPDKVFKYLQTYQVKKEQLCLF